jgi:multiple sugar transport system ATP-binding protein
MNVEKNIGFPLKTQGVNKSEIRKRVREVAKLLHLDNLLKSKVSALSGGDKQRVALGRAIIRRPKAFLMDEPLGSLDAEFRELMCLELKKMHNDINATTVYVTHDQNEAMAMGDRIGIMDKGVMLQADDPLTIYNKPRAKFVGSFIGSPAMNFIDVNSFVQKGSTSVKLNGLQLGISRCHEDSNIDFNYLGIRPENIRIVDNGDIRGTVYGVEYLGANKIITVDTEFGRIKARVPSVINSKIGNNVGLEFDSNSIIIFNGDDETAIKSQFIN